jgi:hypothetical protein
MHYIGSASCTFYLYYSVILLLVTADVHLCGLTYNFPLSIIEPHQMISYATFVYYISMFRDSLMLSFYHCTYTKIQNNRICLSLTYRYKTIVIILFACYRYGISGALFHVIG